MSEQRFKEIFRRITAETPDAPAFSDLETHHAKPAAPIPLKPWMAAVGAAALVLVVVGAFGLLGGGGPDLAAPDENTMDYVKLEYSATVNPVCEGGEIIDNGGFDQAIIEVWGPNTDHVTLMVATFPDGSTERMITEGEDPYNPERAWGIDPAVFEEETGFRSVRCSNPPGREIETFPFLNPPYQPGFAPIVFLKPPPGFETWDEAHDYETTPSELNGNAVTIHSRTESLTPDGEYHIEFHVSIDEPDQLLGLRYQWTMPEQGSLSTEMTVVDLKTVDADSVSLSTQGLFFIDSPGVEIFEDREIPRDCQVTIPSQSFTPPDGYPATPSDPDMVWFGKDELWTAVPTDGISEERKSVWWSSQFTDPGIESSPDITVTYTLLGSPSLTIVNDQGTNASTREDGLFIIAGSEPDIEGCWHVTAIYKNASLSYIYYNPEGQDPATATPTAVVPEVVGMTVDNAMRAITAKGFKPFFVDSDDALYEVCAQDPEDGTVIDIGGAVEMRTAPLGGCGDLMGVTDPNVCYRAPEFIERPTVYFNCSDGTDSEPRPVQRDLATDLPTETAVEQVFAEMLQGPTLAEREASYWSSFSEETADALLSITYQEETQGLVMDFTEAILVNNASTSTGSQFFLGELLANAFQFEEVRSVEFRVNGSCEAFWEFLQAGPICNVIDKP